MNIGTFVGVHGISGYGVILDTTESCHIVAIVLGKDGLARDKISIRVVHKAWISSVVCGKLSNHWNKRVRENVRRIDMQVDRYFKRYGSYWDIRPFKMDKDLVLLKNF